LSLDVISRLFYFTGFPYYTYFLYLFKTTVRKLSIVVFVWIRI